MRPLQQFTNQALSIDEIGAGSSSIAEQSTVFPQVVSKDRVAVVDLSHDEKAAQAFPIGHSALQDKYKKFAENFKRKKQSMP